MTDFNFIAHVKQDENGEWIEHSLEEHLKEVAKLSSKFAESFNASEWAYLAGLWHDLGKYSNDFQHRIRKNSMYDENAHIEIDGDIQRDHATAGAIYTFQQLKKLGIPENHKVFHLISHAIAGHHTGLPDWRLIDSEKELIHRLEKQELLDKVLNNQKQIPSEILDRLVPKKSFKDSEQSLLIRMIFSCLVDADFLDTERFFDEVKFNERNYNFQLQDLAKAFFEYTNALQQSSKQNDFNKLRTEIFNNCVKKAESNPGIYSLTVPTGGGKTLSSMAFALEHAIQQKKERIIYVIPYTSIIEQNADVFRKAFGKYSDCVLEHHSNFDPLKLEKPSEEFSRYTRLASENWNHPIIVTTNVQFFESLFAARTSKCRKLHNIANSVVVIDEVQMLPIDFLKPILRYMNELAKIYKVTFVLSSATQPAFNSKDLSGLENVQEIITDPDSLFSQLKSRIELIVPDDLEDKPESWNKLANEIISKEKSSLCIVNTKDSAKDLYRLVLESRPHNTFHLSTRMCAEHRSDRIKEIKDKLHKQELCTVISTQLVEAGVDFDFPLVYRAIAGLDSIAQAGGRCNREGKLEKGELRVFVPPVNIPNGHLRDTAEIGRRILQKYGKDSLDLERFKEYFEELFWRKDKKGLLDKRVHNQLTISDLLRDYNFRTVAENFKIIDDNSFPVIVPYKRGQEIINEIESMVKPEFYLLRKAQRYSVNLYEAQLQKLIKAGAIKQRYNQFFYINSLDEKNIFYDENYGLVLDGLYKEADLIC